MGSLAFIVSAVLVATLPVQESPKLVPEVARIVEAVCAQADAQSGGALIALERREEGGATRWTLEYAKDGALVAVPLSAGSDGKLAAGASGPPRPVPDADRTRIAHLAWRLARAKVGVADLIAGSGLDAVEKGSAEIDSANRLVWKVTGTVSGKRAGLTVDADDGSRVGELQTISGRPVANDGNAPMFGETEAFDGEPGTLPDGWTIAATNKAEHDASWSIVQDAKAKSGGRVIALTAPNHDKSDTYNLCWSRETKFENGEISVFLRPDQGVEDQGGGLIWRAQGPDDYYIARFNPLETNLRVYYVKGGARKQLATAKVEGELDAWYALKIVHRDIRIECYLDGVKHLDVVDETFPKEGGVGLWTKADAATSFDDLDVKRYSR